MAKLSSVLDWMMYGSFIIDMIKGVGAKPEPGPEVEAMKEQKAEITDLRKHVNDHFAELDRELTHTRARVKELEATVSLFQILVYLSLGGALVALIIALLEIVLRH